MWVRWISKNVFSGYRNSCVYDFVYLRIHNEFHETCARILSKYIFGEGIVKTFSVMALKMVEDFIT